MRLEILRGLAAGPVDPRPALSAAATSDDEMRTLVREIRRTENAAERAEANAAEFQGKLPHAANGAWRGRFRDFIRRSQDDAKRLRGEARTLRASLLSVPGQGLVSPAPGPKPARPAVGSSNPFFLVDPHREE